jgi:hypothetical protein
MKIFILKYHFIKYLIIDIYLQKEKDNKNNQSYCM